MRSEVRVLPPPGHHSLTSSAQVEQLRAALAAADAANAALGEVRPHRDHVITRSAQAHVVQSVSQFLAQSVSGAAHPVMRQLEQVPSTQRAAASRTLPLLCSQFGQLQMAASARADAAAAGVCPAGPGDRQSSLFLVTTLQIS